MRRCSTDRACKFPFQSGNHCLAGLRQGDDASLTPSHFVEQPPCGFGSEDSLSQNEQVFGFRRPCREDGMAATSGIAHIDEQGIENVVILTGDVHSAWGMEVHDASGTKSHAIELVAPAVSSPPLASPSDAMRQLVARALAEQAHVKYADGLNNGYLVVTLDRQRVHAEWLFTGERNVRESSTESVNLVSESGSNRLHEV